MVTPLRKQLKNLNGNYINRLLAGKCRTIKKRTGTNEIILGGKMLTKNEFIELYQKYDTRTLAQMLNCSVPTIYKRLDELDVPLKGRGKGKRRKRKLILED